MRPVTSRASLIAAASLALGQAAATCSAFNPSGGYYTFKESENVVPLSTSLPPHVVQATSVYTCPADATESFGEQPTNSFDTCLTKGLCAMYVPSGNPLVLTGYTNLTTHLDDSATTSLFSLLPDRANGAAAPLQSYCGEEDSSGGSIASFCFKQGTSIYGVFVPVYTCINGTLTGCDAGDPVSNGTAVQICGIVPTSDAPTVEGYVSSIRPVHASDAPQWAGADQCTAAAGRLHVSIAAVSSTALIVAWLLMS